MTRSHLPDGVPADNSTRQRFSAGGAPRSRAADEFVAPDTATPQFAQLDDAEHRRARTVHERHEKYERVVEEDDDDEEDAPKNDDRAEFRHGFHPPASLLILIALGLLGLAVVAFLMTRAPEPTPYCSELPEWNRYNCIPD